MAPSMCVYSAPTLGATPSPDSDLDLLVRMEPGRSLLDLVGFQQDVADLLGIPVDVVSERGLSRYLRDAVLADARRL